MPFVIQRVSRGLNELLSLFGGQTPRELEDRVRGTVELLQFYGTQQRRVVTGSNGALAEATATTLVLSTSWCILFGCAITAVKTATMTALRLDLAIRYNSDASQEAGLASMEGGPFGATETGNVSLIFRAPYPMILPPNTALTVRLPIIGTDATAAVVFGADLGILG